MDFKKPLFISLSILVAAVAIIFLIFSTEPEASRETATKETPMLVRVVSVDQGNFTPTISATGTIRPSQEIVISPRVSGQVIERSPNFVPGGFVEKGEVLFKIDPSDYETALTQATSDLSQARSDLQRELGLQQAAEREYALLEDSLSKVNRNLVLRKPQLESVKAQVESAESSVQQAKLNLERTSVKAPFSGHIIDRNINVGSLVSTGQNVGQLVGTNSYWVETTVPVSNLKWLNFEHETGEQGSTVLVRNQSVWGPDESRSGYLLTRIGSLEEQTRMARLIVEVPDPLAQQTANRNAPKLIIGSFLAVELQAQPLTNVVRLSRNYLRENQTAWVMQHDTLSIRNLDILFQDKNFAYISDGLTGGEKVITTNLATVRNGAALRLIDEPMENGEAE